MGVSATGYLEHPAVPQAFRAVNGVACGLAGIVPQALGVNTNVVSWWKQELND